MGGGTNWVGVGAKVLVGTGALAGVSVAVTVNVSELTAVLGDSPGITRDAIPKSQPKEAETNRIPNHALMSRCCQGNPAHQFQSLLIFLPNKAWAKV